MYISRHLLAESKNIVKPCNSLWGSGGIMAKNTKNVTLSVHRAIFRDGISETLGSLISQIREQALNSNGSVITRTLFEKIAIGYPHYPRTNNAISMRFAFYEEGSQQSTITPPSLETQLATNSTLPPTGTEFLDHEAVILIRGDHLIACGIGNRLSTIASVIAQLAIDSQIDLPPASFSISEIPNRLTVEKIHNIGVKFIDVNVSDMVASLETENESIAGYLFGRLSGHDEINRMNMVARLQIKTKGRKKRRPYEEQPRNAWVDESAQRILNDDEVEQYTIELNDGSKWSRNDLAVRKSVSLDKFGSSFRVEAALHAMMEYLDELEQQGILQ